MIAIMTGILISTFISLWMLERIDKNKWKERYYESERNYEQLMNSFKRYQYVNSMDDTSYSGTISTFEDVEYED